MLRTIIYQSIRTMLNKTASFATLISAGSLYYFWDKKNEISCCGIVRVLVPRRCLKAEAKQLTEVGIFHRKFYINHFKRNI